MRFSLLPIWKRKRNYIFNARNKGETNSLKKLNQQLKKEYQSLEENPSSVGRFTKTLCIFGWIEENKVKTKEIGTSKKLPYIYMVSKKPYIKPFRDVLKTNYNILLVTLDQKTAKIQKFQGSQIVQESKPPNRFARKTQKRRSKVKVDF